MIDRFRQLAAMNTEFNRPDPLDEVLREAHRRGRVIVMHPDSGPVFVATETMLTEASLGALARLDRMAPRSKT